MHVTTPALPRYKAHKIVEALKILMVEQRLITPAEDGYAPFEVTAEYVAKHKPEPGGYWVQYADGYQSFSPAKAFEEGYTTMLHTLAHTKMEQIARVCHEVNRAYCQALGDNSQPTWEDAPEWQRASARMGVDLHTSGDFGPEASHISWMRQKVEEGWVYGPVKNPDLKQHPCIVPFAELPREQQAKDFIFRAVVHALK